MSDQLVSLEVAIDVLRETIARMMLDDREGAAFLDVYDDARDTLLEAAGEAESPADSRRIWIDGSDGTIVVAIRDFAFTPERGGWIMYAAAGSGPLSKRVDGDPGDISVADARRLVGLGGYV